MTRIEEIISNALAGIPETEVAILSREVVDLRGEVAWLKQAPAVVVPVRGVVRDLHGEPMRGLSLQMYCRGWDDLASRIRAIPADRVLRDGEVKILESERRELALLRQHFQLFEKEHSEDLDEADRAFNARQEVDESLRQHLRANQGGAAT